MFSYKFFCSLGLKPPTELEDTNWGRGFKEGTQNSHFQQNVKYFWGELHLWNTEAFAQQIIVDMTSNST